MTSSLEWTGYLPAAVSAVHALGAVVRMYWERRPVAGKSRQAGSAEAPCRCVTGVPVVQVDVAAEVPATVRVTVGAGRPLDDATAGEESGPW
ncbi:hypothetical protein [Streptomyces halobius]|uniref:Uncharacterized protein n=1 Tax=Streptomyces halobius TaxID=2879846 RepID=A0ABY4LZ13_9ACTN|nr:hypothetical protein [Streptomyces halobius]UQA90726.1 hypothetical protein K9S39_01435 [Streptomyces halobius]